MKREHNIQFPEIPLWLVWGIVCYFVSFKLGSYPILDNNEGLYAEIPVKCYVPVIGTSGLFLI
jgi:hypothetical protein